MHLPVGTVQPPPVLTYDRRGGDAAGEQGGVAGSDHRPFCEVRTVESTRTDPTGCAIGCRGCLGDDRGSVRPSGTLAGTPFVVLSALVFLLPLMAALAGAWLWHESPIGQLLGAVAGMVLGISVAFGLVQRLRWSQGDRT